MPDTTGPETDDLAPEIQTLSDGRLTMKRPQLVYLDFDMDAFDEAVKAGEKPTLKVDISYGPSNGLLIHNPAKRRHLVKRLLGNVEIPESDEAEVELRLDSVKESVAVDSHYRIRIPAMHLEHAKLEEKGTRVYIIPTRRMGWLEVFNQKDYENVVHNFQDDAWRKSMNSVIQRRRDEEYERERQRDQQ